jgi:hypothetical protein
LMVFHSLILSCLVFVGSPLFPHCFSFVFSRLNLTNAFYNE